ncbi:hypothetical protein G9464_20570 [Halostella sp. JP-L12]|uniref:DUF5803 family protein n=1 Tax=Halostella TaxID=1843185 RepID=UPI000EF78D1B|nr:MULTISPECIES: DUF5803 family protein [Halostella]NHN49966.1 hypothetical protein [Halostella sp. JP-L12]
MNRRLVLATVAVALIAVTAGCSVGPFAEELDEEEVNEDAEYDWETNATATITIDGGEYQAVYNVTETSEIEVYEEGFSGNEPVHVRAVQFRYPNGTFVNGTDLDVRIDGGETVIELPDENGSVAYTAETRPKEFGSPVLVDGSYEVVLPPNHRTDNFLFGHVSPDPSAKEVVGDRMHIRWEDPDRNVFVRYYLQRDILIFGGLVAVLGAVMIAGLIYYLRQIRELENKRKEMGLDVETEDDEFDDGPPPGMR